MYMYYNTNRCRFTNHNNVYRKQTKEQYRQTRLFQTGIASPIILLTTTKILSCNLDFELVYVFMYTYLKVTIVSEYVFICNISGTSRYYF